MSASAAMGAGGLGVGFGRAADGWLDLLIARGAACPECLRCGNPFPPRPKRRGMPKSGLFCSERCRATPWQDRFWARVAIGDACWEWLGTLTSDGYGQMSVAGRSVQAHVLSYELNGGLIPDGLELDHLCRNRQCVNPAHLEPVTRGENQRRGMAPWGINARKTECKWGHPFDEANTLYRTPGRRTCRECNRRHTRNWRRERAVATRSNLP
jgi:hypothetical protein